MSEKSPNAIDNVRPLNATQTRNLEKLVNNDFNQLRAEIESFAADQIKAKTEELKAESNEEKRTELKQKARSLMATYKEDRSRLIDEAQSAGFDISVADIRYAEDPVVTDTGLAHRITAARNEIESERDRALLKLAAQRGKSLREVYQASITAQAEQILESIPTAAQLLMEANAEPTEPKGELA